MPDEYMRYLFVLLVLSLAALLWAAMAIARHIKRHDAQTAASETAASALNALDARMVDRLLETNETAGAEQAVDKHRTDE